VIKRLFIILLFAVTMAVFANTLTNGFVFDDRLLITDQSYLLRNLKNILSPSVSMVFQDKTAASFYRPILMFSYFIDYNLWNGKPFGFHLSNLIFHLAGVLLVFYLVNLLLKDAVLAFFAGLAFSIHPLQSEAVAWISGRNDPLMLVFILLSFAFYVKLGGVPADRRAGPLLGLCLSFFLALLTKESAVIFPLAFLGYDWLVREKSPFGREAIKPYFYLALTLIFYFVLKSWLIKNETWFADFSWVRLSDVPLVYGFYLSKLAFPGNFAVFPFVNLRPDMLSYLLSSVPFLLLVFSLFFFRKRSPLFAFGIWWAFIALLPVSGLITVPITVMEHRIYSAMFGLVLAFAAFLAYLKKYISKTPIYFLVTLLLIYFSWKTVERSTFFRDETTLWEITVSNNPYSDRAHTNLGVSYLDIGKYARAEEEFKEALKTNPRNEVAHYNLGYLYLKTGRTLLGKKELEEAVYLDPRYIKAHYNLGILALNSGAYEQAAEKMEQIIGLRPDFVPAYDSAGDAFYNMGKDSKAIEYYELAQKIDPKDVHSKMMLEKLGLGK